MAHFAEIDKDNKVLRVIVVNNSVTTIDGIENEQLGIDYCNQLLGGQWIQTSYNAKDNGFRKFYAGIGMRYNLDANEFEFVKDE